MRRIRVAAFFVLAALAAAAGCRGTSSVPAIAAPVPGPASCGAASSDAIPPSVAAAISTALAKVRGVPGVAIGIYDRGSSYRYYAGSAVKGASCVDASTIFELGSLTKTFTAELVANQYLTNAAVDPGQNPHRWMDTLASGNAVGDGCPPPDHPTPAPTPEWGVMATMTLSMLDTHTSGLPDTDPAYDPLDKRPCMSPDMFVHYVTGYPRPDAVPTPPHAWLYSNFGYGTLGYVLQGIERKPWATIVRDDLLAPLAMTHTYDVGEVPAVGYAQGYDCTGSTAVRHWPLDPWPSAGALRSTLPDMMLYLGAAMRRPGTPAAIAEAMRRAETPVAGVHTSDGGDQGMAWAVGHFGGIDITNKDGGTDGFNSWVGIVVPAAGAEQSLGIVVLANRAPALDTESACAGYVGNPADTIGISILKALN